jgi:hypothetical protein
MTLAAPDSPRPRSTLEALKELAVRSGAVARFIEIMGGPPEFDGCDEEDVLAFICENAP